MALMESNPSTPNVAERRVRPTDRCPLCFSRKSEFVTAPIGSGESTIVECADCNMMFTSPRPEPDAFDQYYPPDYPQHNLKPRRRRWHTPLREAMQRWLLRSYRGYSDAEQQESSQRVRAVMFERFARPFLDAYTPPLHGQRRLLDVGCGVGDYLDRMRRLGWTALGVERSPRAATIARKHFGAPVLEADFPRVDLAKHSFDLVTAWQVLEHLDRPRLALARIADLLAPDGRLILTVPNSAGWAARLFGPAWIGWDAPRHVTHFTAETLQAMLEAEGFSILHLGTLSQSGWIRHSATRALANPNPCVSLSPRKLRLLTRKMVSRWCATLGVQHSVGETLYLMAKVDR
jgi:2-polyprenyl-3-methyl-5-hydroxy-6-metoxy-1,4-benzoquinol methylase